MDEADALSERERRDLAAWAEHDPPDGFADAVVAAWGLERREAEAELEASPTRTTDPGRHRTVGIVAGLAAAAAVLLLARAVPGETHTGSGAGEEQCDRGILEPLAARRARRWSRRDRDQLRGPRRRCARRAHPPLHALPRRREPRCQGRGAAGLRPSPGAVVGDDERRAAPRGPDPHRAARGGQRSAAAQHGGLRGRPASAASGRGQPQLGRALGRVGTQPRPGRPRMVVRGARPLIASASARRAGTRWRRTAARTPRRGSSSWPAAPRWRARRWAA